MITAEEVRRLSDKNKEKQSDSTRHIECLLDAISRAIDCAASSGFYEVNFKVSFVQNDMKDPDLLQYFNAERIVASRLKENGFEVREIKFYDVENIWAHKIIPTRNYKFTYVVNVSWEKKLE